MASAVTAEALKANLESTLQATSVSVVDTSGGCVEAAGALHVHPVKGTQHERALHPA